jgi:DNA-binding beta-propeller fold protein YncE
MAACTLLFLLPAAAYGFGQAAIESATSSGSVVVWPRSAGATSADPAPYGEPEFLGSYGPDGSFQEPSRLASHFRVRDFERPDSREKLSQVPSWINLHNPAETVVPDYAPPAHARRSARGRGVFGSLFESLVVLVYGHQAVLGTPTHVATDSRHRVIISDPQAPAVQVLDGKNSFRIVGGPEHRLRNPSGIAVDGSDNIYVADSKTGLIAVYDPDGRFLRYLGTYQDEKMFQEPTGIGIDRKQGRLYVVDSPAGEVTVLDLQGKLVGRAGGRRHLRGVEFNLPTEIAVGDSTVVVLDSSGTRLQEFDLHCNLLRTFRIGVLTGPPGMPRMGLAVDHAGNIYVSNAGWPGVRIYTQAGRMLAAFGGFGRGNKQFDDPSGLWIDSTDRIYVADTLNSRIQVFQPAGRATAASDPAPGDAGSASGASVLTH